jgi:uncharacterized protein
VTTVAVLEELRRLAPVAAVHGNVDEPALRALLPERRVVELHGARVGLVHDAGRPTGRAERLLSWFPECAAIVYGHSHQPELERVGETWILNPGSPTERRRSPSRSMALLVADARGVSAELVPLA